MKTILRFSGLTVAVSAFLGLAAVTASAQNPCDEAEAIAALDAKIRTNHSKAENLEIALDAGKQYVQRYGECEPKDLSAWLKTNIPNWERILKERKIQEKVKKFDDAAKAKNYDDLYAAGKELNQIFPDNVHFMLPMAMIGLPETYRKNHKYNDDSIKYAKMALAKLKSGTAEPKKDKDGKPRTDAAGKALFGVYQFERNADEAISELTYALGYILYYNKNDKRAGLLYLYEASQLPGLYKTEPLLFTTIGRYYSEESKPINKEIIALVQKQSAAPTDEEKVKIEGEIRAKEALYNGYAERALDAFSHAYKFSDEKIASEKTLKAQVYADMRALFERRFEKKEGVDKWIVAAAARPLPDPASQVAPVFDPEPAKTAVPDPAGKTAPAKGKARAAKGKPASTRKSKP